MNIIEDTLIQIKRAIYSFSKKNRNKKQIVFILGSQRSGTTLLNKIFKRDFKAKVFNEVSKLSSLDKNRIRLNPLQNVHDQINNYPNNLIILKPLVESQNVLKLLDFFEGSKVIWIYRNYTSVILSNLQKFGIKNGINDIRPIFNEEENNWRSENISITTKEIIKEYFSEVMSNYDAAALFWYSRNALYFENNLEIILKCIYVNMSN